MYKRQLYNCAAVLCNGELLGLVPKVHLPNYGEFYEKRHFISGMAEPECIELAGQETLIGTNLLFACKQMPAFVLAAEVCEDLWAPIPPSCAHALAGATVVANLSASDETVGKAAYRRDLVCGQSARLLCTYLYACLLYTSGKFTAARSALLFDKAVRHRFYLHFQIICPEKGGAEVFFLHRLIKYYRRKPAVRQPFCTEYCCMNIAVY